MSDQTGKRRCPVHGCQNLMSPYQCCCSRHWFQLPKATRDEIWRLYRNGPANQHRAAVFAALRRLNVAEREKEGGPA